MRRAIGRKQKDRLDAALPSILEGYCNKSPKPREEAEQEAKEFLQIIEDSASYQFGFNHSIAYCLLGYLCGYYRYYHPVEFLTSFLNNAANEDDIRNGTAYAHKVGINITMPKWGVSKGEYFFDTEKRIIAKGLSSVKYMSPQVADELYELSHSKQYEYFVDLLADIIGKTSLNSRQLDILIKIDFFSEFGNQRELQAILDLFTNRFNNGLAKQIKKSLVDGRLIEPIIKRHSTGVTKSGGVAKSYTIVDMKSILHEVEDLVFDSGMQDISDIIKIQNFNDIMGYVGYVSGKPEDRRKLYIMDERELVRREDGKAFGHMVRGKSIGSGKEADYTIYNCITRSVNKT